MWMRNFCHWKTQGIKWNLWRRSSRYFTSHTKETSGSKRNSGSWDRLQWSWLAHHDFIVALIEFVLLIKKRKPSQNNKYLQRGYLIIANWKMLCKWVCYIEINFTLKGDIPGCLNEKRFTLAPMLLNSMGQNCSSTINKFSKHCLFPKHKPQNLTLIL